MQHLHHLARQTAGAMIVAMLGAANFLGARDAAAQSSYPDKTIRIVTQTQPGGPADIAARLIGDRLSVAWGKPVIVEAILGAGGNLAANHVAKSAPDGYTLSMTGDAAIVTNISLYKTMPYDPVRDLIPISQIGITPNILVVHNNLPVKSVQELVALARAQPSKLSYAHGGVGFSQHLAGEIFKSMAGIDIQQIPFRGGPAIMPDLMSGRVDMCFCNISFVLPLVREGKLRALAITSVKRSRAAPELPTVAESGFPGFDVNAWTGFLAPAGTPAPIIDKLYKEAMRALAEPDVRDKLDKLGMDVVGNSPAEFAALIRTEIEQRRKAIEAAGIERQ